MTNTDERFDRLEAGLDRVGGSLDRVAGRLDRVEGRLDTVEGRLDTVEGRLDRVDGRLDRVDGRLDTVESTLGKVESRLGGLEGEVQKLRLLGEENTQQIKLLAEVQSHHGTVLEQHSRMLDQIVSDITPLKVLPDLLRTVIKDHERRITALAKRP